VAMASSRLNKKYAVSWGQRFSIVYSFAATQKMHEFKIEYMNKQQTKNQQ
jgi:hypothetical protein